jgi:hypothetical protein
MFVFSLALFLYSDCFINDSAIGYKRSKECPHFETKHWLLTLNGFLSCLVDRWTLIFDFQYEEKGSEIYICSVIMNIKLMKTIRSKENIVLMYTFRPDLDCGRFLHMTYSSSSIVSMCQMNWLRKDLIFCFVLYEIYMIIKYWFCFGYIDFLFIWVNCNFLVRLKF